MQEEQNVFQVMPLGAGREVGRSCFYVKFDRAGTKAAFLMDCGINPSISEDNALSDIPALPFFDLIDQEIDFILISHFHNDHVSALPFFISSMKNPPPIYMTSDTRTIMLLNLKDMIHSNKLFHHIPKDQRKSTADAAVEKVKKCIKTIAFNEFVKLKHNISLVAYPAGHVIGACMFHIEIAGFSCFYTGDYSMEQDLHLKMAELPQKLRPDVLITEGTYGTMKHTDRKLREIKFIDSIVDTLQKDGRVLLPVFAIGRVQELLRILDNHWHQHLELQKFPIYYISTIGKDFSKEERYVQHETDALTIQKNKPCVIFCTPGMLQSGVSRTFFDEMAGQDKNLLLVTGYGAEGSFLSLLLNSKEKPTQIKKKDGTLVPLKIRILELSFSAHSDVTQTMKLLETLRPKHLVLIHGSKGALSNLEAHLIDLYHNGLREKDDPDTDYSEMKDMKISVPDNGEAVKIKIQKSIQAQYNAQSQPFEQFIQQDKQLVHIKQSGIDFEIIDQSYPTQTFVTTLGCDVQFSVDKLKARLETLFGNCFVKRIDGSFICRTTLLNSILQGDDSQFVILKQCLQLEKVKSKIKIQASAELLDEEKTIVESLGALSSEELKISLLKSANGIKTPVLEQQTGYYLEVQAPREADKVQLFILDKMIQMTENKPQNKMGITNVIDLFGCGEEKEGYIEIENIDVRPIYGYWICQEGWQKEVCMEINKISMID
ncbi:Cleavage and polyadenylation specificity factor, 73 kDa subunit [Spironucleus salmonicida]|uniref:Cleavage and polyadenylation specificity factor, 73 kDa subunit n=1 Tax=Spironucleus salmonicida TaxID=348837 RepID=V6LM22_9EUKA|nr:Cleavage and polyadenylation specificity factor, 73 kDa subunit [Spironucleus salmonicida]|eukprot:EST45695.1 Cleavage and polyadenylation specificity factor, 73 kDa subunit [Spironucleus salmonicida]